MGWEQALENLHLSLFLLPASFPPLLSLLWKLPKSQQQWFSPWLCCAQLLSRVRLCDPVDCSLRGSSLHGILQVSRVGCPALLRFPWLLELRWRHQCLPVGKGWVLDKQVKFLILNHIQGISSSIRRTFPQPCLISTNQRDSTSHFSLPHPPQMVSVKTSWLDSSAAQNTSAVSNKTNMLRPEPHSLVRRGAYLLIRRRGEAGRVLVSQRCLF